MIVRYVFGMRRAGDTLFGMAEQVDVGGAIRSVRTARGLSLRRTAAELGVSPATMSAIEHGRTVLSVARLHRIAGILDVPPARLLLGRETVVAQSRDVPSEGRDWRSFEDLGLDPVLEAASRVFVRRGFHAAGMREVAAEADLSVAGVYHHYPSKEQILVALLDIAMAELAWRIAAAREEAETPEQGFALMVEALALFHAVRGDLAFLGASEMRGLTGAERDRIVGLRNDLQYALDDQARTGLDAGVFHNDDPHTATRAIATMCTSLRGWFRPDGPLTPEQVARQYAGYALAVMGARAASVSTTS
jgi:AcrR family transcriptional regulator/DNA-binding XRE family transcriptional regulator